jgi:outer membrane protein assembly factor BamB
MRRLALALSMLAVTLAGCAKKENVVNPAEPMWRHRPGLSMQVAFRRSLAADPSSGAKTGTERGVPAIDVRHRRIFVGTSDKGMYALRATDGSVLWRFQTAGSVQSEPLYDEDSDVLYFGSDDDGLYSVRASDGALRWRYRTGAEVQRRPVLATRAGGKKILVFCNAADSVFAVDADTGAPLWKRLRTPALGLEVSGHAGVAVSGDRVYAGFSTGLVVAYDLETGNDKWSPVDLSASVANAQDDQQRFFDVDTTPVVHGDHVYVASISTGVYALDATGGGQVWRRPEATSVSWLADWSEPAHVDARKGTEVAARELVIAGSGTTGLWALDPRTGEVKWRQPTPRGAVSYPVTVAGALMVTTSKSGLFLLEPTRGEVIDGIDPGTGFAGGAAAFGNRAFVLTNGGVLVGLEVVPPTYPGTQRSW